MQTQATLSPAALRQQNRHQRFGGRSEENRSNGFRPGFQDISTGRAYLSRYADGSLAPFHLLDGLPETLVIQRGTSQHVAALKASVIAGFIRWQHFYTREQAADATCNPLTT